MERVLDFLKAVFLAPAFVMIVMLHLLLPTGY
jgi:hypothetical protein